MSSLSDVYADTPQAQGSRLLLSGAELSAAQLQALLQQAAQLKQNPQQGYAALPQRYLALLFDKPSLRTRFSFTLAMQQLGGQVAEAVNVARKDEAPEDLMRVLQGYCDIVMVRTFDDRFIAAMAKVARVPLINGLTDLYHPCQILADLLTLQEQFSQLDGLTVSYIGDGNNILHSLLLMAPKLGVTVRYCCPSAYPPQAQILAQAQQQLDACGRIIACDTPQQAVCHADAVYTDVWDSMGYTPRQSDAFAGFQVNEALMQQAKPQAVFMHCMPMVRGQEVSQTLPDQPCSVIFQQSENRLHAQKALILHLLS